MDLKVLVKVVLILNFERLSDTKGQEDSNDPRTTDRTQETVNFGQVTEPGVGETSWHLTEDRPTRTLNPFRIIPIVLLENQNSCDSLPNGTSVSSETG